MNTLIDIIIGMVFFTSVIIIHELGHWIVFRLSGLKVGLKINKLGDLEIGRSVHNKLTLWQSLGVSIGGVALGLLPLILGKFFLEQSVMTLFFMMYFFMCFGDLNCIVGILNTPNKKQTMMQFNISLWKDYVNEMKKAGEEIEYNG